MLSFASSKLFDEKSFYRVFIKDLDKCEKEVIIESPFITSGRMKGFRSLFKKLLEREVKIHVFTRDPNEHEPSMKAQSEVEIANFERIGVQTFICKGNHHRKLAILDRKILWEGSLNILSQTNSREIMRRIEGEGPAMQMFEFLKLGKFI